MTYYVSILSIYMNMYHCMYSCMDTAGLAITYCDFMQGFKVIPVIFKDICICITINYKYVII